MWKAKNAKKYRHGVEYGSARWGTPDDIKPFINPKFDQNILLTQTERVMVGRNKIPKYNINKNVLVIGGSGSGKGQNFQGFGIPGDRLSASPGILSGLSVCDRHPRKIGYLPCSGYGSTS